MSHLKKDKIVLDFHQILQEFSRSLERQPYQQVGRLCTLYLELTGISYMPGCLSFGDFCRSLVPKLTIYNLHEILLLQFENYL